MSINDMKKTKITIMEVIVVISPNVIGAGSIFGSGFEFISTIRDLYEFKKSRQTIKNLKNKDFYGKRMRNKKKVHVYRKHGRDNRK